MPGSRASVFGDAEDFGAALSADGVARVLLTGCGEFQARLTQVGLEQLRLSAVSETRSRIAFIAVPAGMILVAFPIEREPSAVWGGIELRTGEVVSFGSGERLHAKTAGSCHWGAIQF